MILLLAGTSEGRALAALLAQRAVPAVASLSGATRKPRELDLPTRIGGFGGEAGFRAYLAEHAITAVINATHPFADAITARTARICAELGLPLLRVERPGWRAEVGDDWTWVGSAAEAPLHIPPGATVFLATGRQSLPDFAPLTGRRLFLRLVDPPEGPFPYTGDWVMGRPPFVIAEEIALLVRLGADWLVAKDSGGEEGRPKLLAARSLGLPVLMLRRPVAPVQRRVSTVDEAVDWLRALPGMRL